MFERISRFYLLANCSQRLSLHLNIFFNFLKENQNIIFLWQRWWALAGCWWTPVGWSWLVNGRQSKHLFTDDHDGVQLDDQVERCMLLAFPSVCCCNHFSRVTVVISQRVRGSIYRETMRTISKKVSSHLFSPLGRLSEKARLCGKNSQNSLIENISNWSDITFSLL